MIEREDLRIPIYLTPHEAEVFVRPWKPDQNPVTPLLSSGTMKTSVYVAAPSNLLRRFTLGTSVFYMLIAFGQAVLDVERLGSSMWVHLYHYAGAYFWFDVSAAMLLATLLVFDDR